MPPSAVYHGLPPTPLDRDPFFLILRLWAFTRPAGAPTDRGRKMGSRLSRSTARRCVATITAPLGAAGLLTRRVRAFSGRRQALSGATWGGFACLFLHRGIGAVRCHDAPNGANRVSRPAAWRHPFPQPVPGRRAALKRLWPEKGLTRKRPQAEMRVGYTDLPVF